MKTKLTVAQNVEVLNMLKKTLRTMGEKYQEQGLDTCSSQIVENGFKVKYNIHLKVDEWIVNMDLEYNDEKIGFYTGSITDLDDRYIGQHASLLMDYWGFQLTDEMDRAVAKETGITKAGNGNPTPLSVLGLCKKLDWVLAGFVTKTVSEVTTSHTLVYQEKEIELSMGFKISLEGKYFEMYLKTPEPRETTAQWYGSEATVESLLETITQFLEGDEDE